MADSVDRVFVHALATVRRLPRTGSSRPPPASRLRLYGLYKQSMEGDVSAILPRPTLPISSPDPNINTANSVHRYASRDLRTREAQAEIEKWDAWNACAGMSRTEAKRQYISTLIDTMKEYASGTAESRELVGELEFVWNQIKNQSGSDPDNTSSQGSGGGKESPTRKLERAGMGRSESHINSMSFSSNRPSIGSSGQEEGTKSSGIKSTRPTRPKRTLSGLRVLSPLSQRDTDSIVEPVEAENDENNEEGEDDGTDNDSENLNTAPTSPLAARFTNTQTRNPAAPPLTDSAALAAWQDTLSTQLRALQTEIAALREQLSANHLLSSSSYSHTYYTLNTRQRIIHRARLFARTWGVWALKQVLVQCGMLLLVVLWGRVKGDHTIEQWAWQRIRASWRRLRSVVGSVASWLLGLFGPGGWLGFVGRIFRVF